MWNGIQPPKKSNVAIPDTINRFKYSAKEKYPKGKPAYSGWYPAVNSLSASGKSNGPRLVSAVPATK